MRILVIAWVPSLLLLLGGIAGSAVLTYRGIQAVRLADHVNISTPAVVNVSMRLGLERHLSLVYLTDPMHDPTVLSAVRRDVDAACDKANEETTRSLAGQPAGLQAIQRIPRSLEGLPAIRQKIDIGQAGLLEIEEFYSNAIDVIASTTYVIASMESEHDAVVATSGLGALLRAGSAYFQADDFALIASTGHGLSLSEYSRYAQALGSQRALLDQAQFSLDPAAAKSLEELRKSPAWLRLEAAHDEILRRGPAGGATTGTAVDPLGPPAAQDRTPRPIAASGVAATLPDVMAWETDSLTIVQRFGGLGAAASKRVSTLTHDAAQSQIENAAAVTVLLLLLGLVVLVTTTRASSQLIGRLHRLREETLLLSQERLPGVVARLRQGEQVDVAAEVTPLDLGEDEIGQVAQTFNQAQETAIAAAVGEAEAHAGLRTVFINIARRSHGIVHRQLDLLDKAERSQEDPAQLALLYELDHLTTRARRNAENLIILGGGQAGRQWRNPVPLLQVVRGAISEARDYVRVSLGTLPQADIMGGSVADIVHVIAELVDNATSFSPPTSRVEVRGRIIGRGVALEIEDQGLGIEPQRLEQLNEMLHQPPDFQVMALAGEPRLGIFVVAQLAARHGIRVTLVPSPVYGGTIAIVIIPPDLVSTIHLRSLPTPEATTVDPGSLARAPIAPPAALSRRHAPLDTDPTATPSAVPRPQPSIFERPVDPGPGWSGSGRSGPRSGTDEPQ